MSKLKCLAAVAALSVVTLAPSLSEARVHHRYHRYYTNPLPYPISYIHNYGSGGHARQLRLLRRTDQQLLPELGRLYRSG